MAVRKTLNLLPGIFRTDTNEKFLSATIDQLVSEPNLTRVHGYIGRKFAPTYKKGDSYVTESSFNRQNYQLEPSIVVKDKEDNVEFFSSYIDLINQIKYYGGITNNHNRLFDNEYYTFDPHISLDKLINFTQYYWLPNGPDPVNVSTEGVDLTKTFTVTRDASTNQYIFDDNGTITNNITLARGGSYEFVLDQTGNPFWIQTELGVDGKLNSTPTISSRSVLGVTNNGADSGTVTFNVPQSNAQDRFIKMASVYNVDYATPLAYSELHNRYLSSFLEEYPQYAGITGNLDGKTLIFIDVETLINLGEPAWTAPTVINPDGNPEPTLDAGVIVPDADRYGVWKVVFSSGGINDPIIRLVPVQSVDINEKVFIRYGVLNANKEYYKDYDGFFHEVPLLSSTKNTLYIQDENDTEIYKSIKIVEPTGWSIDVDNDILGKKTYTSPNGIVFTSGLKIRFGTDVTPSTYADKEYYVENVGDSIRLVDVELMVTPETYLDELALNYPDEIFPDYITIVRGSIDLNAWSRNNRWFHQDIIIATAGYNNTPIELDQNARAKRPIVQFESNLKLLNYGTIGKRQINILDTTTADAFNELEGKTYTIAVGTELFDGMRILFAADNDPLVRDKIYVINLVQYEADPVTGLPTGDYHIKLTIADDGDADVNDSVVVTDGPYKGSQWWYDGNQWYEAQQKTGLNQAPLFDVFDLNDNSLTTYSRSTFAGSKIFGYKVNTANTADPILGFGLSYRSFTTQGDIEFTNFFDTDTFEYTNGQDVIVDSIAQGFLHKITGRETYLIKNVWQTVVEPSKQYQLIEFTYDEYNYPFVLDITPRAEQTTPNVKVFLNNQLLKSTQWTLSSNRELTLTPTLNAGDKIIVAVFSDQVSKLGHYEVPSNLNLNAQNIDLDTLTLGQMRNHLVALSENSKELDGNVLGASNLRDIELKAQGGNILQHSAPVPYSALFLLDKEANFVNSVRLAQQEYSKFKYKFLELSSTLSGVDPTDPVATVDLILTEINKIKNATFPWYYSDMVPYGPLKTIVADVGYTIFDPLVRSYEIINVFNNRLLSNQAILVYLNGVQLVIDKDYYFNQDRPAVTINETVTLEVDDILTIVEYSNTDGNYIPETPTKLGLYPKFIPEVFEDDTYRTPVIVIRGHDGSLTPAFGDYRDDVLLELEKRIYNNIKVPMQLSFEDIYNVLPGRFRDNDYTINEANRILSKGFLNWIGNNKIDFSENVTFKNNDAFTWNYSGVPDRLDGSDLPGSWRACYQYFYDTDAPNTRPWEMLGFSIKPDWWEGYYGPAPYTGGNALLWEDLEQGRIVDGDRAGIDPLFARPGLTTIIPVDANGGLIPPSSILCRNLRASSASKSWTIGEQGPAEIAWRRSSEFPYAVQIAMALAKPGKYFGLNIDIDDYRKNNELGQFINSNSHHIRQTDVSYNGYLNSENSIYRTASYLNWIADQLINLGIDPSARLSLLVQRYQVQLAYKMAGFSDHRFLQVLAEQSSPSSTNESIVIPDENYDIHLYKSTPVDRLVYSAVIVEKTDSGYTVKGYDVSNPYFTIIPSVVNSNARKIKVLDKEGVVYLDYQPIKLTVPYGYEFKTLQQTVDFLISYERYLMSQGFTFNKIEEELGEIKNWKLSVKELLFWAQQGWNSGSILVLSPISNSIAVSTIGAIVDEVSDRQYESRVVDQNFKLIKRNKYNITRSPEEFTLTLTDANSIVGYIELNLVQYEHTLIFDNSTVFNDIIYKPELGSRQYRLKLIGQKTGDWNGSMYAPGFIYGSAVTQTWNSGKDYLKGDIVKYKDQLFVALNNVPATAEFDFTKWKLSDAGQFNKGLLTNFSSNATRSKSYYDSKGYFQDQNQLQYSHGLIGFKPRQYLSDIGLDESTQIEFYKGYIKQKGTANSIEALTNAQFSNLDSQINFYEEWAIRVGEYGALDTNPYIEIVLDEKEFGVNPARAEFLTAEDAGLADGLTKFSKTELYRTAESFSGYIALNRTDESDYDNDIPTAGYVNIDDVDTTIFDLTNYQELNSKIDEIGTGYRIWVAKNFSQEWDVLRVTETDNNVIGVKNDLDGFVTFTFEQPHGLEKEELFFLKQFITEFNGFYRAYKIVDLNSIMVEYAGDTTNLTSIDGRGLLFKLDSMRFSFMEDSRVYGLTNPKHGWKIGDKIWIDTDAATSLVQGQPVNTVQNTWKVYEKQHPWSLKSGISKPVGLQSNADTYGSSVRMSYDLSTIAVGGETASRYDVITDTTTAGVGEVNLFVRNYDNEYEHSVVISPSTGNTYEFGSFVDFAIDRLGVGSPGSESDLGFVHIYNRPEGQAGWNIGQVVVGNVASTGDRFGSSISFDESGRWLYVGAPGNDLVYVYGLDETIELESGTVLPDGVDVNVAIPFTPQITDDADSLLVKNKNTTFVPNIDYVVDGGNIQFNFVPPVIELDIIQQPYYVYVDTLTGNASSEFGYFMDSSLDGAQLGIGVPNDPVTVNETVDKIKHGRTYTIVSNVSTDFTTVGAANNIVGTTFVANTTSLVGAFTGDGTVSTVYAGAGSVHVYDRVIEAFDSTDSTDYVVTGTIGRIYRVLVDDIEVDRSRYSIVGSNTVRFITPLGVGKVVYVETNEFNLLELLTGTIVQEGARFGTSLTICSNNCAIYVGAPYYDNGSSYNTGSVFKFHHRGRLYGTNTGSIQDPTFVPNDTIRLDNFEVKVKLRLSGTVTVSEGDFITQSSSGANVTVTADSPTGGSVTVSISDYNNANVFTLGSGVVSINGTPTTAYPRRTTLDEWVEDINSANLLGITAVNEHGYFRLNSDRTVAKNLLRTLSGRNVTGSDGVYADSGMAVFAEMQIILSTFNTPGEFFGTNVILARNAYMLVISTGKGTTKRYMTFDVNETVFDDESTTFTDQVKGGGSVYIYELYDDPRDAVEDPGRYAYAQQLDPEELNPGDEFGHAIDIVGNYIMATAPNDDTNTYLELSGNITVAAGDVITQPTAGLDEFTAYYSVEEGNRIGIINYSSQQILTGSSDTLYVNGVDSGVYPTDISDNTGKVYLFENLTGGRGWKLISYETPKVDIDSINRMYMYDKVSNTILANMEFIDPVKGKIMGQAEQEISYKTEYDPAVYNMGSRRYNGDLHWGAEQVGRVWWNLNKVRFLDYEQGSLTYRSINWGRFFPGSVIEVAEWVESTVPPSQYDIVVNDGTPLYPDDSAYVRTIYVDTSGVITNKYYYWVINKPSLDKVNSDRKLPVTTIKTLIENPKSSGVPYAAVIHNQALIVYNASNYLSASDTVLHVDYELIKNSNIIHSEYELVQKNNGQSRVAPKVIDKMIDSLAGLDILGRVVPDPKLSVADRYGISVRPRQSMFKDRFEAMKNLVGYVNNIFASNPIAKQYRLDRLLDKEKEPNFKLNEYNQRVDSDEELTYIDTEVLNPGYKVLVTSSVQNDGLWTLNELSEDKEWILVRIQSYDTTLYWEYQDWYAKGYDQNTKTTYVAESNVEALKLSYGVGDVIRIANSGNGEWQMVVVNSSSEFELVGIQNGTIKLLDILADFTDTNLGFGNSGYDLGRYAQSPNIEIRNILNALRYDIFTGTLTDETNKLFFVMMNYALSEQKYIDWIFKTSFVSIAHRLRNLDQLPNYIRDNQSYYQDYINEVKPYKTKIREYLVSYDSFDQFEGSVTDFDLPAYYDTQDRLFRSPSGEQAEKDSQLWQQDQYSQWYGNRTLFIESILVEDGGSDYTEIPTVTIVGNGSGAEAHAVINGDTGAITSIVVDKPGSGYTFTPTVIINGNGTGAKAYAVLKNTQVRGISTTMKFDRITYSSTVQEWATNSYYNEGDIVSYQGQGYRVLANITTGLVFTSSDYELYSSELFTNANDRIMAYYDPQNGQPAKDLKLLVPGVEYPGVQVTGLPFTRQPGFNGSALANLIVNSSVTVAIGDVITQTVPDVALYLSSSVSVTEGDFLTQGNANITVLTTSSDTMEIFGNYNSVVEFDVEETANVFINGVEQEITTFDYYSTTWSNVGITTANIMTLSEPMLTVSSASSGLIIVGILDSTADFETGTNIKINGSEVASEFVDIEYRSLITDTPYDSTTYDAVEYDEDGNPILSTATVDTVIRSTYADTALGTRPEDIDVVGGAYVDTYSSHAPEELIPGVMFETLDMKIYTNLASSGNVDIAGYRIFYNMRGEETYLRISDSYTTMLTQELALTDTVIHVGDASKMPAPNPAGAIPGAVFINGERITYFVRDLTNNTLGQIRRGTWGTGAPELHPYGTYVVDGGLDQIVPGVEIGNVEITANTSLTATTTKTHKFRVLGNLTVDPGDFITVPASGSNVMVVGKSFDEEEVIDIVKIIEPPTLDEFATVEIVLSAETTIYGPTAYFTEETTGANVLVFNPGSRTDTFQGKYAPLNPTGTESLVANVGNILINGVDSGLTAVSVDEIPPVGYEIEVNGSSLSSNVYALAVSLSGDVGVHQVRTDGEVNVYVGNVFQTANALSWYNAGDGVYTTTDGTGLEGSTTMAAEFIKEQPAIFNQGLVLERTVNIFDNPLITEDSEIIIEE